MSNKKHSLLGMNPSTASHRLVKDLLWRMITESKRDCCYHCGEKMTRETFSIEHKKPWMDSENPLQTYFDLENISFSHLSCNVGAARKTNKLSDEERETVLLERKTSKRQYMRDNYTTDKRRSKYHNTGW